MVRPQRLFLPAHPHHVIQRGHNHGPIFLDDEDRRQYLHHLAEVAHAGKNDFVRTLDGGCIAHEFVLRADGS